MGKELVDFVTEFLGKAENAGLILEDEREINFGVQLKFCRQDQKISVNIYFSKKKGISTVIGGSPNNKLRPLMRKLLKMEIETASSFHKWKIWAGTDESGKGDFFGPLVVCGFIANEGMLPELKKIGVKDSKLLNDAEIRKMAKRLYACFFDNIEVLCLFPSKYNELYAKFRQQNKKLNELLAWMHGRIILNLKKKHKFEGAVVDKFAGDRVLLSSLKDLKNIELQNKIKAEEDPAVASASIIARYIFLKRMDEMSEKYGMKFPKGASDKVVKTANDFATKFGKEKLREVAKIHFKTFDKIKG